MPLKHMSTWGVKREPGVKAEPGYPKRGPRW